MNSIEAYGKKITAAEYVKREVLACGGKAACSKADLGAIAEEHGLKMPIWKYSKEEIYDALMESGKYTPEQIAEKYQIGIPGKVYLDRFRFDPRLTKLLRKSGFLRVVGFRKYKRGKKLFKEPLYDAFQYEKMNSEQLDPELEKAKKLLIEMLKKSNIR